MIFGLITFWTVMRKSKRSENTVQTKVKTVSYSSFFIRTITPVLYLYIQKIVLMSQNCFKYLYRI